MPVTEFQPILDPSAFVGACAGLAVGISAMMMDMDVKKRRDLQQQAVDAKELERIARIKKLTGDTR